MQQNQKYNDQFNALKNELADVEENIRAKQAVLKITDQALTEVDLAEKQIDDLNKPYLKTSLVRRCLNQMT